MEKTITKKDATLDLISRLEKTSEYAEETFVKNFDKSKIMDSEDKEFIQEIEYMRKCISNYFYSLGATDKYTNERAMELWYGWNIGLDKDIKQFGELFGTWCKNPICIDINGFEANKYFDIMFGTHNSEDVYDKISEGGNGSEIEYCSQDQYINWLYENLYDYIYDYTDECDDEEYGVLIEKEKHYIRQEVEKIKNKYPCDYNHWSIEHGRLELVILQNKTFSDFYDKCKDEKQIKEALHLIESFVQTVYPYNYAVIPTVAKGKDLKELGVKGIEVDNAIAILTECCEDVWYHSYTDRNMNKLLVVLRNYTLLKQLDIAMQNIINNKNI